MSAAILSNKEKKCESDKTSSWISEKMAQRSNVGGTVQSWWGVAAAEQRVVTASLGDGWGSETKLGWGDPVVARLNQDKQQTLGLSRRCQQALGCHGEGRPNQSGRRWLSPSWVMGCRDYGDIGLCEGCGYFIFRTVKKGKIKKNGF